MVISTQGSRVIYTANGVTTSFNFPNYIKLKSELIVSVDNIVQTINTHYTISGTEPLNSGANIVFVSAPANGALIKIRRNTGLSQSLNLTNSGAFNQEGIEDVLDDVVLKVQDAFGVIEDASGSIEAATAAESAAAASASASSASTSASNAATSASNAATSASNAATSASNAATSVSNAATSASNANTSASNAATSASNASVSAAEASAIAAGSLNIYTLLPSGTWAPTLSGEAKQITGTTTIDLPTPAANFRIHYHVIGNQTVTVNRNGSENIIIGTQTFTDDVQSSEYGFFTITCLNGADYVITKSNTTDIYAEAPTGADGEGVPVGGTTGQVLAKIDGTDYNTQWTTVSGTGDVVGPASSTDNAVARFDTTTGKLVQNSEVTIDDSGNIATSGTVDGRDLSVDGTKLDGIEALADVTDTANVTAAGALMDSEVTNLAQVKAFNSTDYATAAQGTLADSALQSADIGVSVQAYSAILDATTASFTTTDETKLDGIEALADVTDTANVTAAGALMDSEVDANLKTLSLPASTTISTFGASLVDDANSAAARVTLDVLDPPIIIACSDETTAITTGNGKVTFRMPYAFTLTGVRASVTTAPTGSTIIIDINENGTPILSTKLSIDASEKTSTTAASAAVISDTALADDSEIRIDFDQVGSSTAGAGVKVYLIGTKG